MPEVRISQYRWNARQPSVVMATHSHLHVEYAHRVVNRLDGSIVTETTRQALRG